MGRPPIKSAAAASKAKFPYTNKASSLRRFLKEIPKRPVPPKFDKNMLRAWGFKDSNDYSILRVVKAVGLLNDRSEPSDLYTKFMDMNEGARALGPEIQRIYAPLFQASHQPYEENNEKLKNLFHIHSGGSPAVIDLQIQTFKALCENAVFGDRDAVAPKASAVATQARIARGSPPQAAQAGPMVHIDLHIHLPENKSRRDYEDIIENIARHIFGRQKSDDQ
jgi:hypothetical protein